MGGEGDERDVGDVGDWGCVREKEGCGWVEQVDVGLGWRYGMRVMGANAIFKLRVRCVLCRRGRSREEQLCVRCVKKTDVKFSLRFYTRFLPRRNYTTVAQPLRDIADAFVSFRGIRLHPMILTLFLSAHRRCAFPFPVSGAHTSERSLAHIICKQTSLHTRPRNVVIHFTRVRVECAGEESNF